MSDSRPEERFDKRLLTEKFNGQRGEAFDGWASKYLDQADGQGDNDASWAETFLGTDRRGGLTAAEMKRRVTRNREAVASLILHQSDDDLVAMIRAEAKGLQGVQVTSDAKIAWDVMERECRKKDTSVSEQGTRPHGALQALRALGRLRPRPLPARHPQAHPLPHRDHDRGYLHQGPAHRRLPALPCRPLGHAGLGAGLLRP